MRFTTPLMMTIVAATLSVAACGQSQTGPSPTVHPTRDLIPPRSLATSAPSPGLKNSATEILEKNHYRRTHRIKSGEILPKELKAEGYSIVTQPSKKLTGWRAPGWHKPTEFWTFKEYAMAVRFKNQNGQTVTCQLFANAQIGDVMNNAVALQQGLDTGELKTGGANIVLWPDEDKGSQPVLCIASKPGPQIMPAT